MSAPAPISPSTVVVPKVPSSEAFPSGSNSVSLIVLLLPDVSPEITRISSKSGDHAQATAPYCSPVLAPESLSAPTSNVLSLWSTVIIRE